MEDLYPAGPQEVPATLTQPTSLYKRQAWLAVASLALFVVLYFALAGWFGWTAWRLVNIGLAGGEGALLAFGVGVCSGFLCIFMLKALLFVNRGGAPDDMEIKPDDQPQLFAFLNRLADEAGAPRPHRVFMSARVNAAVFYDLSIVNLLFPSRKNLEIGLSLVNVLTLSEFKAVLAHEFGHFAQRSMAIGSWVYIAQQIASQVISKRDALDKLLRMLSNTDLRIAWLGWILSLIVWSIRSLLDTIFRLVVLAQRALSRQMEFQADLVAVSLTGSDELVHALHKLQAADEAWDRTLSFANSEFAQGRSVQDLFLVQSRIIDKVSSILGDPHYGKAPLVNPEAPQEHRVFNAGFAQPPQMWSTHPANSDRENNAKRFYIPAPHDSRSAWVLFRDAEGVRQQMTQGLFANPELKQAPMEESLQALEKRYQLMQYDPNFRGAYLGRFLARHAESPAELYQANPMVPNLHIALASLYPPSLREDLNQLRTLQEEKGQLEALRDKVYKANGDAIRFRGNPIARRDLASIITQVSDEIEAVRTRIIEHDRRCRSVHLATAEKLGQGWKPYLQGLINVLHYAEHSLANLRDAQGLLANVVAVVTADGKVSSRELKRLLKTANELHGVLIGIHAHKSAVVLDTQLLQRMEIESWAGSIEDCGLPTADNQNVNDWMRVIDGWVNSLAGDLSHLVSATLEQILKTEDDLGRYLRLQETPPQAPKPSTVAAEYHVLLPGSERKRQKKLDLWDRFQIADGVLGTSSRLVVALAIVGSVLGFSFMTGLYSPVEVYNGLGTTIVAQVGDEQVQIAPFKSAHLNAELRPESHVVARTPGGDLIEDFQPSLSGPGKHYIYNVAGASPLVRWTASYGNAPEREPQVLGSQRWKTASVDVYFAEPPKSVKTKNGGATRTVLSGFGHEKPEDLLNMVANAKEAAHIAAMHARWDNPQAPTTEAWKALATRLSSSASE